MPDNALIPQILAIDAGGTMTDTFLIDQDGNFVVGKAQTTPHDESIGFIQSAKDALNYWELGLDASFPHLKTGIYSGTAMLNRLLERKGREVGVIVSGGMEDYLRTERAIQTYLGYPFSDRLHVITHHHNEPLVPRERILGVRGRIDLFGREIIPLYEGDVRDAVDRLIDHDVASIVVCLLFSYKNKDHERRVREIGQEVMAERGVPEKPIYLSSELYPTRQDFPRLNSTIMEAYAAEPSRETLQVVQEVCRQAGGRFELRIMASHGGTISINARELARTMISGPIGGVVGSKFLSERIGVPNIACTDIGGTSFDIALITDGEFSTKHAPDIGRILLNMPMVRIDSVGSGTGSYVRVNPITNRIEIGPDSAGAMIGVSWPEGGVETVTITDCNIALGYLNPDYFLGGDITLSRERAIDAVRAQVADPLGIDVYQAAAGVLELFEDQLKNSLLGLILGKGYTPESYTLLCYGGGGPLHVAGYSQGLAFDDILVPAWAPGFSAFGCACGEYAYRYDKTLDMALLPGDGAEKRRAVADAIIAAWDELKEQVNAEFEKSGVRPESVSYRPAARMLYYGQLNDLEVPVEDGYGSNLEEMLDGLCDGFEAEYGKMYGLAARTPQFGYMVTAVVMTGSTPVEKPELPDEADEGPKPPAAALKAGRNIYEDGQWVPATILDLQGLRPGNVIEGPAIVESPASTMLVPAGRTARLDRHSIFHLTTEAG